MAVQIHRILAAIQESSHQAAFETRRGATRNAQRATFLGILALPGRCCLSARLFP